jgi:hypothetical protein
MDDEELQLLIEQTRRFASRLGVRGVHHGDQIDALVRDQWPQIVRIALGGSDVRETLGREAFDALARLMAMKLITETVAASIGRAMDSLADHMDGE